ncbi:MAG: hypothetical protein K0S20_725 [Patescibacteria group bacterium]|nr:hypothetical protein [Patescibacteria group bacterium]
MTTQRSVSIIRPFDIFKPHPKLRAGVSTTSLGNVGYQPGATVASADIIENRKMALRYLGLIGNTVVMPLMPPGNRREAERVRDLTAQETHHNLWRGSAHYSCSVGVSKDVNTAFLAYCNDDPIIVAYDPRKEAFGIAFAGLMETNAMAPTLLIETLMRKYGCHAENILVAFSPCLQGELSLFDGQEMASIKNPLWDSFIVQRGEDCYQVDIPGFAKKQLLEKGVSPQNIEEGCDIFHTSGFYSATRSDFDGHKDGCGYNGVIIGLSDC